MTNRRWLAKMTDDELAEWLCKQFWRDYGGGGLDDMLRFNHVRNFLKMPYPGAGKRRLLKRREKNEGN